MQQSKFVIKRIETGDLYGIIDLDSNEIGQVSMSNNYASINFRKAPSPLLVDLNQSKIIELFPYQTCFSCISRDEKVIVIHSERSLNYHTMPTLERKITLDSAEIPEMAVFANENKKIFLLYKDTKQIIHYRINLDKNVYQSEYVLQDRDISDMKTNNDETVLLICSLHCIYVVDIGASMGPPSVLHKLKTNDLVKFNGSFLSATDTFNGFGSTLNNKIIYATVYTFLVCYNAETGRIQRVFQSTLSANRIVKSYSCRRSDTLLSLLDNGRILQWNLSSLQTNEIKFEDMRIFSSPLVDCFVPKIAFDSAHNCGNVLSYCGTSPDLKVHALNDSFQVRSSIKSCYEPDMDNPLSATVNCCHLDDNGRFCFIVSDIDEFGGKRQPIEANFVKKNCVLLNLAQNNKIIERFSYIVRKNSRFEINAHFFNKNKDEVFLLVKLTSCINDFDPYTCNNLHWSDFETSVKVFGPLVATSSHLELLDEFKMFGECLNNSMLMTTNNLFISLMHECSKLYDRHDPAIVRAKRYECHLNTYDLFKSDSLKTYSLNEFLTMEQYNYQNILLDVRVIFGTKLLLIYSKQGARNISDSTDSSLFNQFEYDYDCFRFNRDIQVEKSGLIFDTLTETIVEHIPQLFDKSTNVNCLLLRGSFVLDNNWHLYDMKKSGQLLKRINIDLSFKWTQFVFDGSYLISVDNMGLKICLVRCSDSFVVASFLIGDPLTCLKLGESDRTILVGTKSGNLLALRLLIDLEYDDALNKFVSFYRCLESTSQRKKELNLFALNNDMKRVIHSAHAHRQLKSKESRSVAQAEPSEFVKQNSHKGITTLNMTNLAHGIKHSNNNITTRACNIQ